MIGIQGIFTAFERRSFRSIVSRSVGRMVQRTGLEVVPAVMLVAGAFFVLTLLAVQKRTGTLVPQPEPIVYGEFHRLTADSR